MFISTVASFSNADHPWKNVRSFSAWLTQRKNNIIDRMAFGTAALPQRHKNRPCLVINSRVYVINGNSLVEEKRWERKKEKKKLNEKYFLQPPYSRRFRPLKKKFYWEKEVSIFFAYSLNFGNFSFFFLVWVFFFVFLSLFGSFGTVIITRLFRINLISKQRLFFYSHAYGNRGGGRRLLFCVCKNTFFGIFHYQ